MHPHEAGHHSAARTVHSRGSDRWRNRQWRRGDASQPGRRAARSASRSAFRFGFPSGDGSELLWTRRHLHRWRRCGRRCRRSLHRGWGWRRRGVGVEVREGVADAVVSGSVAVFAALRTGCPTTPSPAPAATMTAATGVAPRRCLRRACVLLRSRAVAARTGDSTTTGPRACRPTT